jgi:hypothetical protein
MSSLLETGLGTPSVQISAPVWAPDCRIVLVPSFDYELFHGRGFVSPDEALFEPAKRMMDRAAALGIPITLFADICSVWRHRDVGETAFADRFEEQLIAARTQGHDVQLHIHAHWMASDYSHGEWRLSEPKVTLADFDFSTGMPRDIVRRGVEYLEELLRGTDPAYKCLAFRAGGLALQPHERELLRILRDNGITIDSSIAKDYTLHMDTLDVDYRSMPRTANWMLSESTGIAGGVTEGIFEVPIVSFSMGLRERITFLIGRALAMRERRGASISRAARQTRWSSMLTLLRGNARYLTGNPVFLFSADTKGYTRQMLVRGFRAYVEKHLRSGEQGPIFISMMNHPKLMFPKQENLMFDVFEEIKTEYGKALEFATFPQIAAALEGTRG